MDLLLLSGIAQAGGAAPEKAASAVSTAATTGGPLTIFFQIVLGIALLLGLILVAVIFVTGKGDAMSGGGGGVRTTFKGKASFDDRISQYVLYMGAGFMALMVLCDVLLHKMS